MLNDGTECHTGEVFRRRAAYSRFFTPLLHGTTLLRALVVTLLNNE
ncbi:hypothetical protein BN439_2224 [Erwinia amylovora Ea644]|nr:hypothetical protein BN439_2224 [Erwinia amylovora Ea644]